MGHPVETVSHHKVPGLVIMGNLKWNGHISMIIKRPSSVFISIEFLNGVEFHLVNRAWGELDCSRLNERRYVLCESTIKKITDGYRPSHLLPQTGENVDYDLRNFNNWASFKCRTDRFQKSFFPKYD